MRKSQIAALTVAIAISAGSFSMLPAERDITAGKETAVTAAEESSRDSISYEDAIADLYARSAEITDDEILEIAGSMEPSAEAVAAAVGADEAKGLIGALKDYEAEKAAYLLSADSSLQADSGIRAEWDLQSGYSRLGFTKDETITSMIPGFTVTACQVSGGRGAKTATVEIDEWMTQSYTTAVQDQEGVRAQADGSARKVNSGQKPAELSSTAEDVTAYRYYFTLHLEQNTDGTWTVDAVSDTEQNYAWLQDFDRQAQQLEAVEPVQGKPEADGTGISCLRTYGAAKYSYSVKKAVAYADKWSTSRNPKYKNYPGVDCANFVSQCLCAGGIPVNDKWYPASYAWVNCMGAISNFKKYGKFMSAKAANVLEGNPVYYDWNSDGTYDHTAICVGKNNAGTPIVDAHTGDHYHATWTLGGKGKRATIQLRGSGGTTAEGSWKKIKGKWYYYSANGKPVKGWLTYKNKQYYLSSSGRMVTGWKKIKGSWYYFNQDGVMKTGWLKLSGRRFYLQQDGKMKTGWVRSGKKMYYLCAEGSAVTGWQTISGEKYYFKENGAMTVGISRIDGNKYYFNSKGHMTCGWVTMSGRKYFFSPSAGGRAATGYWDINGTIYYFNDSGALSS